MAETVVQGTEESGNGLYAALYEEIMSDVGKMAAVERSYLSLKPEVPLFIMSVRMRAKPAAKTIGAVASTRAERGSVYVSISDELYAPGVLRALWARYGRDDVVQTDRSDITVRGADASEEVDGLPVESQEQPVQEIIGALWRVMPEGIRNRRVISGGGVITAVATEEVTKPEYIEEAMEVHGKMVRGELRRSRC